MKIGIKPHKIKIFAAFRGAVFITVYLHYDGVLYIGPRNTQPLSHLPLGQGLAASQAVPQGDDLPLPAVQEGVDILPQLGGFQLEVDLAHHVHLLAHDIHEGEAVPLPVGVHRLAEADVRGGLAAGTEVHEDLIFNTLAGIGRKLIRLLEIKGRGRLDKADGADGDQVLLLPGDSVILFDDVGHQPEVVLDEGVFGGQVPLADALQAFPFLAGGQGLGEGAGAGDVEGEIQQVAEGRPNKAEIHRWSLLSPYLYAEGPGKPASPGAERA